MLNVKAETEAEVEAEAHSKDKNLLLVMFSIFIIGRFMLCSFYFTDSNFSIIFFNQIHIFIYRIYSKNNHLNVLNAQVTDSYYPFHSNVEMREEKIFNTRKTALSFVAHTETKGKMNHNNRKSRETKTKCRATNFDKTEIRINEEISNLFSF